MVAEISTLYVLETGFLYVKTVLPSQQVKNRKAFKYFYLHSTSINRRSFILQNVKLEKFAHVALVKNGAHGTHYGATCTVYTSKERRVLRPVWRLVQCFTHILMQFSNFQTSAFYATRVQNVIYNVHVYKLRNMNSDTTGIISKSRATCATDITEREIFL